MRKKQKLDGCISYVERTKAETKQAEEQKEVEAEVHADSPQRKSNEKEAET